MSELVKANRVAILPSQAQPQEIITIDNHGPHVSIDELLKVIKEANGMPVLFVPSTGGRLTAVAVDGLQNPKGNRSDEKKEQAFRSWLLLLASLVATVSFAAGLTPPGGVWAADDKANGYIAGTSVMGDKFYRRYMCFYFSNSMAFFASLMIIGMLAKDDKITAKNSFVFRSVIGLCLLSLGTTYTVGTSIGPVQTIYSTILFAFVFLYVSFPYFRDTWKDIIQTLKGTPESVT